MKQFVIAAWLFVVPAASFSQLGGLLKKLKNTASSTAENKADNATAAAVSTGIDKLFSKKSKKPGSPDSSRQADAVVASAPLHAPGLNAYAKFDFVPGTNVVYAEDFAQDALGEFPLNWTTKTKGMVMKLQGQEGQWLRGYKNSLFTTVNKQELAEDYTVEFDLIYYFGAKEASYVMPNFYVRILNNYTVDYKNASGNVADRDGEKSFQLNIHPKHELGEAWIDTYGMPGNFKSDQAEIHDYASTFNRPAHYAIQVQKSRVRIWIDEKKVFDLPQVINSDKKMARVAFGFGYASYDEEEIGFYVSNIRVAGGNPDTRHKLLETGNFSTSGIRFNVNSDVLKPESAGILREVARVLNENPSLNITIAGHTSSDGSPARNKQLSLERADAVKKHLSEVGGISPDRLGTTGLGDTKPVASNDTQEGRAQNRRVEFTKR